MKKLIFLLLLALSVFSCSKEKGLAIRFNIEGKNYEQLAMVYSLIDSSDPDTITGIKKGDNKWVFPINDSFLNEVCQFSLFYAPTEEGDGKTIDGMIIDKTSYMMMLNVVNDADTIQVFNIPVDPNMLEYNLTYSNHNQIKGYASDRKRHIFECDYFMVPYEANSELGIYAEEPEFLTFYNRTDKRELSLEEGITYFGSIIEKFPDSRYLIGSLNSKKNRMGSNEAISAFFDKFSEKNKQSPFGQSIKDYLDTNITIAKFENTTLPKWDTEDPEEIIQDKSRNTLIVFSASWCGPCRKQIPVLKEIYADLKDKLDIVYVSMDERKTLEDWRKEMKEEAIPWRSVLAADNLKEIRKRYFIRGIPHTLLYRANEGTIEKLDVRKEEGKALVYDLAK